MSAPSEPAIDRSMGNGIAYDDSGWHDAGLDVWHSWDRLSKATTIVDQAMAVEQMANAMAAFGTWLPGYDYRTSEVADPRDED